MVRLARAPRPVLPDPEPRPVRRRRRPSKLVVILIVVILAALNREPVERFIQWALDKAKAPVEALQADGQMRKAEEVLVRQWRRDGTYQVSTDRLGDLDPEVEWDDVVRYRVCFRGAAAVITADTATGTESRLLVRGFDHGTVRGDPGCPASEARLAPWGPLSQ